jgi:dTDP-4-amino-4,6-dideoxygalactose transaminase
MTASKTGADNKRTIAFSRPSITEAERANVLAALESRQLAGGGPFMGRCEEALQARTGAKSVLMTTSCTAALEMSALLAGIGPGDEVIMPTFTFVSTANAFVLRGGVPVFVDNRADTLNIDETKIEAAITERTKAIVPVHYAGVACEMDAIMDIADRHGLTVIEDAAQGLCASYKGKALGNIGHAGTFSFHETKNIVAGEGGALLLNDDVLIDRALTIREKGTNRRQFLQGQVDKYTWVDVGSSYIPSELQCALLFAQLERAQEITDIRLSVWNRYQDAFAPLEAEGLLARPTIPEACVHNAHIYYVLMPDNAKRNAVLGMLREAGIGASFHFVPLHSAPAGQQYGRVGGDLSTSVDTAGRLARLPLHAEMSDADVDYVIETFSRIAREV